PLRFRDVEWNHVRRDDEEFGIRELSTPPLRVAAQPPPQGNLAVDATPDVADVDEVLQVYPRVHVASAVGVGDEMLFGLEPFLGFVRGRGRNQRLPVLAVFAFRLEGDFGSPRRS